ncbi:xanthine dehydrogenase family protein molybdopterin-binding subunit [Pusillimonas sp. DMV24BSW_D]|uniref:xanthine dehydrogenase family protein molybdopterin-binding subunit n=1 Tax=Neopusillimonas aestuarii TaxID=2716226 RepID=UPI00140E860B|nr:molybdopterin cofactor-binding domain-containing protein [Pusillimonas sp. DMV24BSW_D]QIM47719.1 xanthine dehydrogenase family protein molybdopterin-binding subunit [Pusillimonas sp. DMV24BSW_D]
MELKSVSRRSFLVGSGATMVGVMLGSHGLLNVVQAAQDSKNGDTFSPIAWVVISPDNKTLIYSPASEMGQGTMTSLPAILAEDMELDWSTVSVEKSPSNAKLFGNPRFGGGLVTGSSRTVVGYYDVMRLAGLQAKLALINVAAKAWSVPANEVVAENSVLKHGASKRQMTYGEAAAQAGDSVQVPAVDKNMLKPMSEFRIIGKNQPRVDVPAKSSGKADFGIDAKVPGMVWAAVMRTPVQGEKPEKVDDTKAKAVKGVQKVVTLPYGVAVVADTFATAKKARDLLQVTWTKTSKTRSYDSDVALQEFVARAEKVDEAGDVWHKEGDVAAELKGAARTVSATFTSQHVAQCTMEPMNCIAMVNGDKITFWVPSQSASIVTGTAAAVGGFKPENIQVNITYLGGGYGRRVEADYAADAVFLAKAMPGIPVHVLWTREDDFLRSRPRPLTAQHIVAGLDDKGNIVGWHQRVISEGIYARFNPKAYKASGNKDAPVMEGADTIYAIPGQLFEHGLEQRGLDVSFWRGVGAGYTKFAIEAFIDEIAGQTNQDPLALRLALTKEQPRAQKVLEEVAAMAEWKKPRPEGRALGLAFSDTWTSFVAMVVEVSMSEGKPVVHHIWAAVDCGHAVSPRNIASQIEGSALFGLSALLDEKLVYKGGQAQQTNFHQYNLLRANQTPLVDVKVIPTDNAPGGIGEAGLPPVAPAVANAVAKLTGKRVRTLPFPKEI